MGKKIVEEIELGEGREHDEQAEESKESVKPVVNTLDMESRYQAHLKKVGGK